MNNWTVFMVYREKVEVIEKEEWITYRGSINKYAELVAEYIEKMMKKDTDRIGNILKEIIEEDKQGIAI